MWGRERCHRRPWGAHRPLMLGGTSEVGSRSGIRREGGQRTAVVTRSPGGASASGSDGGGSVARQGDRRAGLARGAPFGDATWQKQTAVSLGLKSSLRQRGRPRKATKQTENNPS